MNKLLIKIKQAFCSHKNTQWKRKGGMFYRISGDTHYLICDDCGKVLAERNIKY